MTFSEILYPHVAPFMMVLARLGGLFAFAPVLSSPLVPVRAKGMLVTALGVCVYATLPVGQVAPVRADIFSLGAGIAAESFIGVIIGLAAAVPVYSVQLGGLLMDQQIGVGLAGVYNPAVDSEGTPLGDLLLYVALAVFMGAGGLDSLLVAVVNTFGRVPLGGVSFDGSAIALLLGLLSSGFELALRVAAPVLGVILLETVATSLLMRTLPQLNVMSIGFSIKIFLGFGALVMAVSAIERAVGEEVSEACAAVLRWAGALGGA
jgi:flagellar biosynthesis protein FliR